MAFIFLKGADRMESNNEREWHPIQYVEEDTGFVGEITPPYDMYVDYMDRDGRIERLRLKQDIFDHFYPRPKVVKEDYVVAWRYSDPSLYVRD